ncbi:hypothetical protein DSO57_1006908 [Entomophthora muscae]|uniref:Uncharacterized protein n=1 Tax=Entomophthora muscae TaxID=34485 RepID=A0ACC2U685_9FUNG|nr:hypothetical protein DSO57_1006908 [Entomophthora muscae]
MSSNGTHDSQKSGDAAASGKLVSKCNQLARHFNVICNTLVYTDGRDKSMKTIQYTLSVLMITVLRKHKILPHLHASINGIMSMFGDARKVVRLANFTGFFSKLVYLVQGRGFSPYQTLTPIDDRHYPLLIIKTASEFLNAITDDLFCLSRFNVIDKELGTNAKQLSIKLWWTSLSIDFYLNLLKFTSCKSKLAIATAKTNSSEKSNEDTDIKQPNIAELNAQLYNFKLNLVKIFSDMIFCGYDLFHIKSNLEYMHFAAVVSGFIGYYRLWVKTNIATKA